MSGIRFIISAPSGSGKSTLVNELRKFVPNLEFSVSYTTRQPRGSEQDGQEYHFISREEFEGMIMRDEFLEYAQVFGNNGNYYGTARKVIEEADKRGYDLLLDIDVQGATQVKDRLPGAVSIFVLPPSRAELESRLRKRSMSEHVPSEEIRRRLDAARKEIENYRNYDYILVNDRLEQSLDNLVAIVQGERARRSGKDLSPEDKQYLEISEKCLKSRMEKQIKGILDSFDLPTPTAIPTEVKAP
jgi:guanylate kinase